MVGTHTDLAMRGLQAEEGNLLYARRMAQRHERWADIHEMLDGLSQFLPRHGRRVAWERRMADGEAEVTGSGQGPISGREDLWAAL